MNGKRRDVAASFFFKEVVPALLTNDLDKSVNIFASFSRRRPSLFKNVYEVSAVREWLVKAKHSSTFVDRDFCTS